MKTELYTNCSLVRIPIKAGVDEYYLPQNVDWASERVDKMVICAPAQPCKDPMDGVTPVLDWSNIADCYLNLYDKENHELMHDVSFEQVVHYNNNVLHVDAELNLSQCRIYFTTAPSADATLLLYVFYKTRTEEYYDMPKKSVTVQFELDADQEISFRDIIDYYVHAIPGRILGMICWNASSDPAWITLRDHDLTYQMANIHSEMCRPDMNAGTNEAKDCQAALFLLNDLNINFDYSNIREATGNASSQVITFLYN